MKFMNMKRFGSAAMAGALALSLTAPAFASKITNVTGNYNPITLSVAVPTTGKAIINPYGLPYTVGEGVTISGEKIVTASPLTIQNLSSVPLDVNVSIVGTATGNFTFASTLAANETGNKGVVNFEVFNALRLNATTIENTDDMIKEFAALKSTDAVDTVGINGVSGTPDTGTGVITLREADSQNALQSGGAAYFRLAGEVVKSPNTAWAKEDGFTAAITFTFEPSANPYSQSAGTLGKDPQSVNELNGVNSSGTKLLLTSELPSTLTPTAQNTKWEVSDTTNFTITPDATNPLKATVKTVGMSVDSGTTADVTVTITDAAGIPYIATVEVAAS